MTERYKPCGSEDCQLEKDKTKINNLEKALKEIIRMSDYTNAGDNCKLIAVTALRRK